MATAPVVWTSLHRPDQPHVWILPLKRDPPVRELLGATTCDPRWFHCWPTYRKHPRVGSPCVCGLIAAPPSPWPAWA